jgi:hypothetical protein
MHSLNSFPGKGANFCVFHDSPLKLLSQYRITTPAEPQYAFKAQASRGSRLVQKAKYEQTYDRLHPHVEVVGVAQVEQSLASLPRIQCFQKSPASRSQLLIPFVMSRSLLSLRHEQVLEPIRSLTYRHSSLIRLDHKAVVRF